MLLPGVGSGAVIEQSRLEAGWQVPLSKGDFP